LPKEEAMKYALLIYSSDNVRKIADEDRESVNGEYEAIFKSPGILDGLQLQPGESATTVRVEDGQALLTDGPFVDAKEYLGGFFLLEADNLDAATEMATRVPAARMGGAVEVRPVMER
jgi:hypothetical protein